jgi:hypothetical protein
VTRSKWVASVACLRRPNKCQKRPTLGAKETYYMRTFEILPATCTQFPVTVETLTKSPWFGPAWCFSESHLQAIFSE